MSRVLFDSDVLLDVLAQRHPFFLASAQALNKATQPNVEGYLAGHAVTNLFYLWRRQVGRNVARELLSTLLQNLQVAAVTDAVIRAALRSNMSDFEDAVTSEAARVASVDVIVTRNTPDFAASSVSALLPLDFIAFE